MTARIEHSEIEQKILVVRGKQGTYQSTGCLIFNQEMILKHTVVESLLAFLVTLMLAGVSPFLLLGEEVMRPITVFSYVNQLNKFKVYSTQKFYF